MNKIAIIAAAALSAATFGAAALAQSETDAFENADGNKDGTVSYEEAIGVYPTLTQAVFDQADANADGTLDEAEFTALVGLTAGLEGSATTTTGPSSSSESSAPSSAP